MYFLEAFELDHKGTPTLGFAFVEKDTRKIDLKYIKNLGIPNGPLLGKLQQGKSVKFKDKKISPDQATIVVPGKKIAYMADTVPCKGAIPLAKNADILIASSTYASIDKDKAKQHSHITSLEAAQIASQANVKKLILTHFSTRYKDTHILENDARTVFDNTEAAKDFLKIRL